LVHAFTALIGYLFWPYVVFRSRDVAAKDELGVAPAPPGVVTPASSHDSSLSQRGLRAGVSRR
jgi:hypothetical protein